ncbi:alkaline phosphatase family protein [Neobacillus mesonae]|uniref:alkaline phosphatase family protein n=1 Tax=Neobacillus mesonae TaxID=1193713 RepID=UPI002E243641|nr:alkaline phosphatase family protein [Neobacillus mesonae]MED4206873.1 alkaline phosphatase family protein [Neobacillus mesonae]
MLKKRGILILLAVVVLNACAPNLQPKNQTPIEKNIATKEGFPNIDHIVIVIEENRSQEAIEGNKKAPYINSLMKQGANFTNYYAIEHPSQPNYLDLFSGSNQGVTDDKVPNAKFTTDNLASELLAKNYTFAGYSEDLPSIGFEGESTGPGGYARKHNPWVNFTNVPKEANQPLTNFPKDFSKLPTVSFVIPALRNDMHDGSIKEADDWLKEHIDPYVQWATKHNSLLIVTWDEDDHSQDNKIPTFFVGPMVKPGQYNEKLNHYNLLRTLEDLYGLKHLGESKKVEPIKNIWK